LVGAVNKKCRVGKSFCAIFGWKLIPGTVCELMRLTVVTVSVVPAGIVAAFKDAAETQAQQVTISRMNLFCIIFGFERLTCELCRRKGWFKVDI